jgi:16S rRNA (cytidine1402-2'-O)-methyltransferase
VATGTLYLVPNLLGAVPPTDVLPARTIAVVRLLQHFVVETPKVARHFIKSLDPETPLQSMNFTVLDEHTSARDVDALLDPARGGRDLGLISDAGCPAVADPGALLVAAAHRESIRVVPLVGPSAILLALMASGLDGQNFCFHGYLPVKPDARAGALKALDDQAARTGQTQIFIETPYRNDAMLAQAVSVCRLETMLCVAAELTTTTESVITRPVRLWRTGARIELARKPVLFLIGRAGAR